MRPAMWMGLCFESRKTKTPDTGCALKILKSWAKKETVGTWALAYRLTVKENVLYSLIFLDCTTKSFSQNSLWTQNYFCNRMDYQRVIADKTVDKWSIDLKNWTRKTKIWNLRVTVMSAGTLGPAAKIGIGSRKTGYRNFRGRQTRKITSLAGRALHFWHSEAYNCDLLSQMYASPGFWLRYHLFAAHFYCVISFRLQR